MTETDGVKSSSVTDTSSAQDHPILPLEEWLPGALVTTYGVNFQRVDFFVSEHDLLVAHIYDEELQVIVCTHLSDPTRQPRLLMILVSALQDKSSENSQLFGDRYSGLRTLLHKLKDLELARLDRILGWQKEREIIDKMNKQEYEAHYAYIATRYCLTVLGRVRSEALSLVYRRAPMTCNGGQPWFEETRSTVPGKISHAKLCLNAEDGSLFLRVFYWYRWYKGTYGGCEDTSSFHYLNDYLHFQQPEAGRDSGDFLDLLPEVQIAEWRDEWVADWDGKWNDLVEPQRSRDAEGDPGFHGSPPGARSPSEQSHAPANDFDIS